MFNFNLDSGIWIFIILIIFWWFVLAPFITRLTNKNKTYRQKIRVYGDPIKDPNLYHKANPKELKAEQLRKALNIK